MQQHHYLGYRALVGESIRYIAEANGRLVARIGWASAAFQCEVRDKWIGWPPIIKTQFPRFLANNTRFLILPGIHIPNLASRILALNLKRLSQDWNGMHGHPIYPEETFVDHSLSRVPVTTEVHPYKLGLRQNPCIFITRNLDEADQNRS